MVAWMEPDSLRERNQAFLSGLSGGVLFTKGDSKMNWDRVEGNWKTLKGQAQQNWGKLTNDDLDVIEGKRVELSGRLQNRYGIAKDEAERQIDKWLGTMN